VSCSLGKFSIGQVVGGDLPIERVNNWSSCPRLTCPCGELSIGRVVPGASFHGGSCHEANCLWASCP
jgi:hypothetical protein